MARAPSWPDIAGVARSALIAGVRIVIYCDGWMLAPWRPIATASARPASVRFAHALLASVAAGLALRAVRVLDMGTSGRDRSAERLAAELVVPASIARQFPASAGAPLRSLARPVLGAIVAGSPSSGGGRSESRQPAAGVAARRGHRCRRGRCLRPAAAARSRACCGQASSMSAATALMLVGALTVQLPRSSSQDRIPVECGHAAGWSCASA